MAHQKFYIQQKALIQKDGKVLVLTNPQGQIDFPGGRVEETDGDNLTAALKREVKEEVGLEIEIADPFMVMAKRISSGPTQGEPAVMIGYRCDYVSGDIHLSDEHNQYAWVDSTSFLDLDSSDEYFRVLKTYFAPGQK